MASTAARSLRFVSVGQARLLNAYVEGVSRVRDEGTLESAINCPINRQH